MNELKLCVVQTDLVWHDPARNREGLEKKCAAAAGSDLVILPEMFTTGFTMAAPQLAETMEGETVKWMKRMAIVNRFHLGGSVIICEDDLFYNRFIMAGPDGEVLWYDKRHTFTMAGEHKVYTQGEQPVLVSIGDWTINLQVCYDLRFPVFSRNRVSNPYDLLIYVANWPAVRINAWDKLLAARAVENQCYVMGVNRVGRDNNNLEYVGHSAVLDPWGEALVFCGPEEKITTVSIDRQKLLDFREKFPVLKDADRFTLQLDEE